MIVILLAPKNFVSLYTILRYIEYIKLDVGRFMVRPFCSHFIFGIFIIFYLFFIIFNSLLIKKLYHSHGHCFLGQIEVSI